jgi:hypothetical protein
MEKTVKNMKLKEDSTISKGKLEKTRKGSAKSAMQINNLYLQVISLSHHGKYLQ